MATTKTYIRDIRAQVKADHNGKVPDHLNLTIRNYAQALELRDKYREQIINDGVVIMAEGSTGNQGLLYQQETLCLSYAKALGGTAAKAAQKPEDPSSKNATDSINEFLEGIK